MYKIVLYDDDKKVMEVETTNVFLMHDVTVEIMHAIDFYKDYKHEVKVKK